MLRMISSELRTRNMTRFAERAGEWEWRVRERETEGAAKKPFPLSPSFMRKAATLRRETRGTVAAATKNFHPPPPPLPFFCGCGRGRRPSFGRSRCAFPNYDFQSERAFPRERQRPGELID